MEEHSVNANENPNDQPALDQSTPENEPQAVGDPMSPA